MNELTPEQRVELITAQLKAEFPQDIISWRAQTTYGDNGNCKALALAYIDARDVMQRLDDVVGINNWEDSYLDSGKRTYCTLAIAAEVFNPAHDGWISKSDAAGDSDVEAEKGAVSDAIKRAAVKWGIGRYLYDDRFKGVWVPCETVEKNGKTMFKSFKEDCWKYVKGSGQPQKPSTPPPPELTDAEKEAAKIKMVCSNWLDKLKAAKLPANDVVKKFSEFKTTENAKGENVWHLANNVYPEIGKWMFEEVEKLTKEVK